MKNNFQVEAIDYPVVAHFFQMSDEALAELNVVRMKVHVKPGFPCRVSLEEAELGEEVVLFPYQHLEVNSPYQSSGPVFVRKNAKKAQMAMNELPSILRIRQLSLRAYDKNGMMIGAETVNGKAALHVIDQLLDNNLVEHIDVHNAKPGCYNCRLVRV